MVSTDEAHISADALRRFQHDLTELLGSPPWSLQVWFSSSVADEQERLREWTTRVKTARLAVCVISAGYQSARVCREEFQIAACEDGPTLYDMIAVRGDTRTKRGRRVIEVEYGPDFGKAVAWLAARLLPSFSFWFDADSGAYLGHRMPLHRKGPEITLVRQGLTPPELGIE